MFGMPGVSYVYFVYGMHYCFNAVTEREGFPAAVLVRALEPGPGVEGRTDGPGRLCKALGIGREQNGVDLVRSGELFVTAGERSVSASRPEGEVGVGARIGVGYAGEWAGAPLRFWLKGSAWVSRG
jgi:DNA-3-methyladenine glycosylase